LEKDETMAAMPPSIAKPPKTNGRAATTISGFKNRTMPKIMLKTARIPIPQLLSIKARIKWIKPTMMAILAAMNKRDVKRMTLIPTPHNGSSKRNSQQQCPVSR
jgi:hypothetical protein